ncbi:hypothetical protein P3T76_015092 [Phytophthora citrophthora]|uniref:Uncharacterized protein n=1 Tax=Phytophthora citrophthora TaxID=4793 RepID=A0AAD9G013_9STRA|nr:hypothetical protein P3T76_015092 [Phytophthora citrophthora]
MSHTSSWDLHIIAFEPLGRSSCSWDLYTIAFEPALIWQIGLGFRYQTPAPGIMPRSAQVTRMHCTVVQELVLRITTPKTSTLPNLTAWNSTCISATPLPVIVDSTTATLNDPVVPVRLNPELRGNRQSSRIRHSPVRFEPPHSRHSRRKNHKRRKKCQKEQQTWGVAYIKDRKTTPTGDFLYRVLWRTRKKGRLPRTWEPRAMLLEDGFHDAVKLVDEWVDGGRQRDFFQFVSKLYPSVAGTNPMGTCMFLALQHALLLVGEPFGVRNSHIEDFLARGTELGQDLSRGISWKLFRAFVFQLHIAGSRLSLGEIEFNRHRTGHRGVAAIVRLPLEDGVYLIAASNTLAVGHAFVLQVRGVQRTVMDDSSQRPLDNYGEWIGRVIYHGHVHHDDHRDHFGAMIHLHVQIALGMRSVVVGTS